MYNQNDRNEQTAGRAETPRSAVMGHLRHALSERAFARCQAESEGQPVRRHAASAHKNSGGAAAAAGVPVPSPPAMASVLACFVKPRIFDFLRTIRCTAGSASQSVAFFSQDCSMDTSGNSERRSLFASCPGRGRNRAGGWRSRAGIRASGGHSAAKAPPPRATARERRSVGPVCRRASAGRAPATSTRGGSPARTGLATAPPCPSPPRPRPCPCRFDAGPATEHNMRAREAGHASASAPNQSARRARGFAPSTDAGTRCGAADSAA